MTRCEKEILKYFKGKKKFTTNEIIKAFPFYQEQQILDSIDNLIDKRKIKAVTPKCNT